MYGNTFNFEFMAYFDKFFALELFVYVSIVLVFGQRAADDLWLAFRVRACVCAWVC